MCGHARKTLHIITNGYAYRTPTIASVLRIRVHGTVIHSNVSWHSPKRSLLKNVDTRLALIVFSIAYAIKQDLSPLRIKTTNQLNQLLIICLQLRQWRRLYGVAGWSSALLMQWTVQYDTSTIHNVYTCQCVSCLQTEMATPDIFSIQNTFAFALVNNLYKC